MTDAFLNPLIVGSYLFGALLGVYLFTKTKHKLATWFSWLPGLLIAWAGVQLNTYILILPGCFLLATIGGPAFVLILRDIRGVPTPSQPKTRPRGILLIAVLWTLVGIYNIYQSLNVIVVDVGVLPHLADPSIPGWFSFGLPAEIVIGFFVFALELLMLIAVYGLVTARSWSYHFALALPISMAITNLATIALYASAPQELGLREGAILAIPFLVWNLVWLVGVWSYLRKPHVKQYLNRIPTST